MKARQVLRGEPRACFLCHSRASLDCHVERHAVLQQKGLLLVSTGAIWVLLVPLLLTGAGLGKCEILSRVAFSFKNVPFNLVRLFRLKRNVSTLLA